MKNLTEAFSGDLPECIDVWQAFLYKDAPAAIWFLTLHPDIFSKLGIKRPTWETDPLGNSFGAGGLFLTLSELHKFGLFYLNKRQVEWKTDTVREMDRRKYSSIRYRQLWLSFSGEENIIPTGRMENILRFP